MPVKTLSQELLDDLKFWESKKIELPGYDRKNIHVRIISFSPGRMGFGHLGDIMQDILDLGEYDGLIAGIETYSQEYYNGMAAADWLAAQMIFENEKDKVTPRIQGAFGKMLFLGGKSDTLAWNRFRDFARNPSVQFATINAPENAYGMTYSGGDFAEPSSETVKSDMMNGTFDSDAAKWTAFALERYNAGLKFAIASCTNYSKNGFMTGATVRTIARAWEKAGFAPKGFVDYLSDPMRFSFPNSMVDRIAVAPDEKTFSALESLGINSTVIATERTRYWALEDSFPGGRPPLEKAEGVFMCENFDEVKKYEDMKLRILNMAHSTIAGLGVLLGYRGKYAIYKAMQDAELVKLIRKIIEIVIEVIEPPKNLSPKQFAEDTIVRLNNPNIPDDPMRIAFNASTKMLPRFMDTYFAAREKGIPVKRLEAILLPVAGFLRYTLGIDDAGEKFSLESDPLKDLMVECGAKAAIGAPESAKAFSPLISNESVMGKDLYNYGETGRNLEALAGSLLKRPGAVRAEVDRCANKS